MEASGEVVVVSEEASVVDVVEVSPIPKLKVVLCKSIQT